MAIFQAIVALLAVIVLIIAIHELGHMLAAKALGVKVERYSVGFGPTLWERKYGDTIYQIAVLPLGGFVKIKGMLAEEEETPDSYKAQPGWKKFLILFMGPFFNFILAALIIFFIGFYGVPQYGAYISEAKEGSPAARAGIERGDMITRVNGERLIDVTQMQRAVERAGRTGEPVSLYLMRGVDSGEEVSVTPTYNEEEERYLVGVGLGPAKVSTRQVAQLVPGLWADEAGFEFGDQILSVDGQEIQYGFQAYQYLVEPPDEEPEEVSVTVEREGRQVTFETQTLPFNKRPSLGISFKPVLIQLPFVETMKQSWMEMTSFFTRLTAGFARLGEYTVEQGMEDSGISGPVGIYSLVYQAAQTGIYTLSMLAVMLTVSIGLFNILPVPALDGGRIVFVMLNGFLALFSVQISDEVEQLVHGIGLWLLLLTMVLITWIDIVRVTGS